VGGHQASFPATRLRVCPRAVAPVSATSNYRLVRFALGLAAAILIGPGSPVHAQGQLFWPDADVYVEAPPPSPATRRQPHRAKHHRLAKSEAAAKDARKPKGPLIIAISIDRQTLKIYDANGFFAETPVSTGMRGHSTPLGVFSVIQKQKWHRSNIYSGAPMPYMQRITWSGIAMHAGVLPGYPASHGCIRMPMSFAVKMFGWTRMGARVIITPGEVTPADISHPMLMTHRPEPTPVAFTGPASGPPHSSKTDKDSTRTQAASVGTAEAVPSLGRTRTADASGALPQLPASSAAIDPPVGNAMAAVENTHAPAITLSADTSELRSAIGPESGTAEKIASGDGKSPDASHIEAVSAKTVAETGASDHASEPQTAAALPATDLINLRADKPTAAPATALNVDTNRADTTADGDKPRAADASSAADVTDVAKDQSQMPLTSASHTATDSVVRPAPKRTGQIAVFVSRKDSKIYVRQNFAPLFDSPVTIAASERPLGTHVFTAEADKDSRDNFHWSVISLPATTHRMERGSARVNSSHHRRDGIQAQQKPAPVPESAADALNRITIPEDVMTKIAESLSTGGSIVVSDQGIAGGETGEGTDFIVTLR